MAALSEAEPVSGSVSKGSAGKQVTLGASWVENTPMPRFTARYHRESTRSFQEGGSGWGPLEVHKSSKPSGGDLIHTPFQGVRLTSRAGAGTLSVSAYSDIVTKSIQIGVYDQGIVDVPSGTLIAPQSPTDHVQYGVVSQPGTFNNESGRFTCNGGGGCKIEGGLTLDGDVWTFTPARPPDAVDVDTDNDTIYWFGGNFAGGGEYSFFSQLPGTRNGVEGFFRCIGSQCSTGPGNRNGEIGPYTDLRPDGNWIFVPATLSRRSDVDYMVFGYWMLEPDDPAIDDFETGAYANGSNPFPHTDVQALIGTAVYTGPVVGAASYTEGDVSVSDRMSGTATLTADFGNASSSGTIQAEFTSLLTEFLDPVSYIRFAPVDIEPNSSTFFFGNATVASTRLLVKDEKVNDDQGSRFTGGQFISADAEWSGKFYGVAENGNPAGVAGIFDANASFDSTLVINAAFGAHCTTGCE